jgi:hypothetical protein
MLSLCLLLLFTPSTAVVVTMMSMFGTSRGSFIKARNRNAEYYIKGTAEGNNHHATASSSSITTANQLLTTATTAFEAHLSGAR